ncbi:hypothetical protein [Desulfofundulus thermobenzoicus]|uniref:hypothetical protein n=1 Tax=Desulfofundulus thermobenzoicus TaxID=29376 RepID=UPI00128EBDC2|nr:hypothetical protein [Desulfofundulus thermobenzoicus]
MVNETAQKMMEHWILGKWDEWWMKPFIGLSSVSLLLLFLCVPALIVVFLWGCRAGNAAPVNFMLKMMFWAGVISVGGIFPGYIFAFWVDMVRERRGEKGKTITFQEIIGENLDFERWCS